MDQPFDVIGTRTLDVFDELGRLIRQVFVHVGRPWQEPTGEWAVPYQIVGLGDDETVHRVLGSDAVQALQNVHFIIGRVLALSDEARQGRLRWDGDPDLGFPEPSLLPLPPDR